VDIADTISERQPAAQAIREVHRQGGVAIAAHPYAMLWAGVRRRSASPARRSRGGSSRFTSRRDRGVPDLPAPGRSAPL
jgi:hypothetical protein